MFYASQRSQNNVSGAKHEYMDFCVTILILSCCESVHNSERPRRITHVPQKWIQIIHSLTPTANRQSLTPWTGHLTLQVRHPSNTSYKYQTPAQALASCKTANPETP